MFAALLIAGAMATAPGWHQAREIVLPRTPLPAYVRLNLPQDVDSGMNGNYASVRIADESNREVPYALDAAPLATQPQSVALSDVGFVDGKYTQAIADLGTSGALHSTIVLDVAQPTFFQRVDVATSDDRTTWTTVAQNVPIYRVAENDDAGTAAIGFGPSRARWVRLQVLDPTRPFPIRGASVVAEIAPPKLVPLAAKTTLQTAGSRTIATLDFGTLYASLDAVAFQTKTPQFSRQVAFATSMGPTTAGPATWEDLPGATISRFASGKPQLTAALGSQRVKMLRAAIENGNDPPLASLTVTALGEQHAVVFQALPGHRYRLLWLNDEAEVPTYDLGSRLAHESWRVAGLATLGAPASSLLYPAVPGEAAPPWLQSAALPLALVAACGVLLVLALVALRRPAQP